MEVDHGDAEDELAWGKWGIDFLSVLKLQPQGYPSSSYRAARNTNSQFNDEVFHIKSNVSNLETV